LVTRFGISRLPAWNCLGDSPELWSRDQALALEVFERVGARADWQNLISEVMANTKSGLPGLAALGYLRFSPGADVATYPELLAKAQAEARVKEPLASVIANWPSQ
ncbi:MAG: hypothetical protein KC492_40970, partial [Myxococcales bacterium]|nr:hypothetical protein [Myxococcales bacterium]